MTNSNSVASGDPSSTTPNVRWNHRGSPQYNSFTIIGFGDLFFNDLLSSNVASQPSSQPTWLCGTRQLGHLNHPRNQFGSVALTTRMMFSSCWASIVFWIFFDRWRCSSPRRDVTCQFDCKSKISSDFRRTCTVRTCLCRTTGFSTIPQKTVLTHFDIVLHRKDRWKGHLVDDTRLRYLHLSAPWDPIAVAQRTRHPADLRAPTCLCTTRGTSPTLSKLCTREPLDNWLLSVDLGNLPLLHQAYVGGLSICCSRN